MLIELAHLSSTGPARHVCSVINALMKTIVTKTIMVKTIVKKYHSETVLCRLPHLYRQHCPVTGHIINHLRHTHTQTHAESSSTDIITNLR